MLRCCDIESLEMMPNQRPYALYKLPEEQS